MDQYLACTIAAVKDELGRTKIRSISLLQSQLDLQQDIVFWIDTEGARRAVDM